MDVQIITEVLGMWLGSEYPGLPEIAETVADSLAAGVPLTHDAPEAALVP